ncbi:hypothetical protein CYMTET_23122 [Cymbomonas tetramitiformis]|uniref:No exine formation 1 n=1 Tax=Cymbomonas tetramitiformis TaxID=36881 RepID=A0AAE0G014_9CHLO|nr:hypothetical protein CYMTET_23122 [Cymbomonas tetramitiformis]
MASRYIMVPAPFSYLLVTVALYGILVLLAGHFLGAIGTQVSMESATGILALSALVVSVVAGMPFYVWPAPLLAALGLAQFYASRAQRDYLFFILGSAISFGWFLSHHFWFLDVSFAGVHLSLLCRLLLLSLALALAIPGLVVMGCPPGLLALLLVAQAFLLGQLEESLYGGMHEEEGLYPAYLVALTSAAALIMLHYLVERKIVGAVTAWVLRCLYGAKLVILVLPGAHAQMAATVVALSSSASYIIPRGGKRMSPGQGTGLASAIFVSFFCARYLLFDAIEVFTEHRPSEAVLLGAMLLGTAAASYPIAALHFPASTNARQGVASLLVLGALIFTLRPPLPASFHSVWDLQHTPEREMDDVAIYGERPTVRSAWPAWLLVSTCLIGLSSLTQGPDQPRRSPAAVLSTAVAAGFGVGVYIASEYFAGEPVLQGSLVAASVMTVLVLTLLQHPFASSPQAMPVLFATLVASLPVGLLLHEAETADQVISPEQVVRVEEVRGALLAFFACVFLLLAFAIKLRMGAMAPTATGKLQSRMMRNKATGSSSGAPRPAHLRSLSSALWQRQMDALGGGWLPALGNTAVGAAVTLALMLNLRLADASEEAIFAIAPLLLLLNQDRYLLTGLADKKRYFPVAVAITFYLITCSAQTITQALRYGRTGALGAAFWSYLVKSAAGLLFTAPSHVLLTKYLWDGTRQPDVLLLCSAPLNIPPMILSDIRATQLLAAWGIAESVTQYFMSRHTRLASLKYI